MKTLSIPEHQSFGKDNIESIVKDSNKAQKYFNELCDFAKGKDNHNFLRFYGKGALKATQYAGLIQTKSGFCVEILPKIFKDDLESKPQDSKQKIDSKKYHKLIESNGKEFVEKVIKSQDSNNTQDEKITLDSKENLSKEQKSRILLLNMLKTLKNSPFKHSNFANLQSQNMNILEIFANMFLDSLNLLIKKGLKCDYIGIESNRTFLKGKLIFSQNLKYNAVHKERFYTLSDEFSSDIAINRLIVSTLQVLNNLTFSPKTSSRITQARFILQDIQSSKNLPKDFASVKANMRNLKAHSREYESLFAWCEIFLKHKSFSTYSGSSVAFALLFDMNKLFESFVAHFIKKHEPRTKIQSSSKKMLTDSKSTDSKGNEIFTLKPDIVIESTTQILILDTKWKIIESKQIEKEIAQSDIYQMWAYASKYALDLKKLQQDSKNIESNTDSNIDSKSRVKTFLIYPLCETNKNIQAQTWHFKASKNKDSKHEISLTLAYFPLIF